MAGLTVEPIGDGWYLVTDGSRRWEVAVARDGNGHWAFVDGLVTHVPVATPAMPRARASGALEPGVMAPMPATVVAIHVEPGQVVQHGDTLLVLEAMKMELPVRSPRIGTIKSIRCAKGDLVRPGVNLLEFE